MLCRAFAELVNVGIPSAAKAAVTLGVFAARLKPWEHVMIVQLIVVGSVVVLAVIAVVRGLTMKAIQTPSLPTGRPEDHREAPAEWYHKAFYVIASLAAIGLAIYYVGSEVFKWF